jgi:hypothetical protein
MTRKSVEGSEKVAVVLHPRDLGIVTEFSKKLGISFSGAVRYILRDWDLRTNPQPAQAEPVE